MYYRRKVLLSLLEVFGGELEKIRLQKLLLLLNKYQEKPSYDFVPYKYGCYSFQANADLFTMSKYKQVEQNSSETSWIRIEKESYIKALRKKDKEALSMLKRAFSKKTKDELVKLTYQRYPYYAINSEIVNNVLDTKDLDKVNKIKEVSSQNNEICLFTIGYEGITLETYLNNLIKKGIKALIDVRKNPLSMKYGFSKNQLKKACESVKIDYYHFPEVGIVSDKRKKLETQNDYDKLFNIYKKENLKKTKEVQKEIFNILLKHKRIALTCFEANICQCHRKPLAEAICSLPNFNYNMKHI